MNSVVSLTDPTARLLADAMRGRSMTAFESRLVDVLHHDIFRRVDNLRPSEACALSYQRLRYLREQMDLDVSDLFADLDRLLALHEWVGLVDGTMMTILTIHYNLCIGSILQHGDGRSDLQPLLDELNRMDSFGVFLATELAYGNNVQALETEAVFDPETREFVIHTPRREAQKFMPNTGADGVPKLAVVLARLKVEGKQRGIFPFIVRIRTDKSVCAGVTVSPLGDKPDYALDNAITIFDHVRVPFHHWLRGAESTIDEDGKFSSTILSAGRRFLTSMERVQTGKLCLAMGALTVLRGSLDLTLRYAQQRKTFGTGRKDVSILSYRTYQQTVFDGVASAYAGSFLLQSAVADYQSTPRDCVATNRLLAIAKIFISSHGISIMTRCRERVGAQGLFSANRIISYLIQTNGVVTAEGDNEILLVKMGRELIVGSEYEAPPPLSASLLPIIESPDYLVALIAERERRMVLDLREALRSGDNSSLFETWNEHVTEAVALAQVHVHRIALETFNRRLDTIDDPRSRDILERLLRLSALQELEKHTTSLLLDGAIDRSVAKQITTERARLAGSLFEDVGTLVDAFDIPDTLVEAPIAVDFVASYDRMSSAPPPMTVSGIPRTSAIRSARPPSASDAPLIPRLKGLG